MNNASIIDPSGEVALIRLHPRIRKHPCIRKHPSFVPSCSDGFVCTPEVLPHRPISIETSTESRRRNQMPVSGLEESHDSSSHQSSSKLLSKRSHQEWSLLLARLQVGKSPSGDSEETQNQCQTPPPPPPCSKRLPCDDSLETASTFASSMLDKYAFMSYRFPITTSTQKAILKKRSKSRDISIQNDKGKRIGSIDYSFVKERGVRIVKDDTGRTCAIIQQKKGDSNGCSRAIFRVYGDKPCKFGQQPETNDGIMIKGCYLWAEIKNTGSMGGKFVMKRCGSSSETTPREYCAKRFGSLFSKGKSKGFTFLDSEEQEAAKMASLNHRAKGIVIAPNCDMCLMLAFCAVVDEMVEQRLR